MASLIDNKFGTRLSSILHIYVDSLDMKFNNVQFDKKIDNLTVGLHVLNLHFM